MKPTTVTNDELLIEGEPIVVDTTTNFVTRNIDFSINSVSEYTYILLKYGSYDSSTKTLSSWTTTLISVDEISYSQSEYFALTAMAGLNWSAAEAYFVDDHTIRILDSAASNTTRTKFAITSIKGIK